MGKCHEGSRVRFPVVEEIFYQSKIKNIIHLIKCLPISVGINQSESSTVICAIFPPTSTMVYSLSRTLFDFIYLPKILIYFKIVSELLGSFGDNELCPECLDGVNDILKSDTICIPQSYENYIS